METDNSGTVQAVYTYGNDLINMKRAGANSYYHYDGLGSTRQLTNSAGAVAASYTYDSFGNVIAGGGMASNHAGKNEPINKTGITLFAFLGLGLGAVTIRNRRHGLIAFLSILLITGQIPKSSAIEVDVTGNPYGFTGEQQFGEASDLVFLRARYYDPSTGRFISRDPIGYRAGVNLYTYCMNSPIVHVDPDGNVPGWLIAIGVGLIIWGVIEVAQCFHAIGDCLEEVNKLRAQYPCDTQQRWNEAMKTEACKEALEQCPEAVIGSYGP
jgi:RHS repeat-associated protein